MTNTVSDYSEIVMVFLVYFNFFLQIFNIIYKYDML